MNSKQVQNNEVRGRRLTALGKTDDSRQFPNLDEGVPTTLGKAFGPSEPATAEISSLRGIGKSLITGLAMAGLLFAPAGPSTIKAIHPDPTWSFPGGLRLAPPYISSVGIHLYDAPTDDWFPVDDLTDLEISISASDPIWGRINDYWDSPVGYDWEDWGFIEEYFDPDNAPNSATYYAEDVTWKTGCYVNASVAAHPDHFAKVSDRSDTEFVYYYGMGHAVAYPREYRNGTPHYLDWYWVPVYSSLTPLRDYPY